MKLLKFFLLFFSILYPFVIVFKPEFTICNQALLAIFAALNFAFSKDIKHLFISIFFVIVVFLQDLKYMYPVLVNLIFFTIFLLSLKSVPIITKIASLRHELNDEIRQYTKKLTIVWIWFFALNAAMSYILSLAEDKNLWAIYCGIISYIMVGVLFFGEIAYRRFILKV